MADPFTEKVQALVVDNVGSRITGINETTREHVAAIIASGLGEGEDSMTSSDLANAIRDLGMFDEARAEMIARTETQFAFNTAALTSYNQYGVEQVQAIDGDYDDVCAERNGIVLTVDEAMSIEDHPNGTLDWVPIRDAAEAAQLQADYEQAQAARRGEPSTAVAATPAAFSDPAAIEAWAKPAYADWQAGLSKEESDALKLYQSSGYRTMGDILRSGEAITDDVLQREIDTVTSAIGRASLDRNVLTFRAVDEAALKDAGVGSIISDESFVSTSLSTAQAERFAGFLVDDDKVPVILDITVHKGATGAYMEGLLNLGEHELLLQRGARFRITYERVINGIRHIGAELL